MSNAFEKLPKWAQGHIADLKREREEAVRLLNKYVDEQTESPVYIDELESLGENRTEDAHGGPSFKRRYVQTKRVTFVYAGVKLDVSLRDEGIAMQWSNECRDLRQVAAIPTSFQRIELIAKENMR